MSVLKAVSKKLISATHCRHLQSRRVLLEDGDSGFSKTLVHLCQTTRRRISEDDSNVDIHSRENIKSHLISPSFSESVRRTGKNAVNFTHFYILVFVYVIRLCMRLLFGRTISLFSLVIMCASIDSYFQSNACVSSSARGRDLVKFVILVVSILL
jgi:hypothetical protein